MLESIKVWVNEKETIVKKGITLLELSKMYDDLFNHKIVLAKVDSEYRELSDTINKPCHIEFFDLTDSYANRVYLNGLVYLTNYCFHELFKSQGYLLTRHSADKGLYMEATCDLTREMIVDLENKMHEVVKDNLRIHKVTILREDV